MCSLSGRHGDPLNERKSLPLVEAAVLPGVLN